MRYFPEISCPVSAQRSWRRGRLCSTLGRGSLLPQPRYHSAHRWHVPGRRPRRGGAGRSGAAVRVQLSDSAHLALDGAGLDFTGWCGRIELPGPGAALLSSIPVEPGSIFFYDGGDSVTIDPQSRQGADSDHTQYTLPVSAGGRPGWAELENADWTYGYTLTVVDGTVTQIEARPSPGGLSSVVSL